MENRTFTPEKITELQENEVFKSKKTLLKSL